MQGSELQVILLLHVLRNYCLCIPLFLSIRLLFFCFCVKDPLLLRKVSDERLAISVGQEAQEVVDLVEYQQLHMWLHPDPVDQLLLLAHERLARVPLDLVYRGHVDARLGLLDGLLCEGEHLLQGLHAVDELWWLGFGGLRHLAGLLLALLVRAV